MIEERPVLRVQSLESVMHAPYFSYSVMNVEVDIKFADDHIQAWA